LAELRGKLGLARLALRVVSQPTSQPLFLRTTDGSKGFVLDVSAPRPGMLMMNAVLSSVIVVGGIFIVFLLLIARHGQQIAGSVEQAAEAMSEQNRALQQSARYDPLTGLANRSLFTSYLEVALQSANSPVAVFFLDLDHFKPINDKFGHEAGDFVLREVGRRLHDGGPHIDLCARLGGDEFVVVASVADEASLHRLCRKLIGDISAAIYYGGESLEVGASIGVALSEAGDTLPDVLRRADKALYQAKNAGRGVYRIHPARDNADGSRLRIAG
jgi:diguanylate cyclase (GGDEF)-like protein